MHQGDFQIFHQGIISVKILANTVLQETDLQEIFSVGWL